ncbi:MAG: hypothetical protein HY321_19945 [Armatimonadetes bacterium]|nr:hypothetical protein [Armatimonadota bacterium]
MRVRSAGVLAALAAAVVLAGCGNEASQRGGIISPVSGRLLVTPEGTPGFVSLGSTDIHVRFPSGAVTVPTTFNVGKVQSEAELIAPLPPGRIFVGGLNFFGAALNRGTPVEFRVPVALTVSPGTSVQVFFVDPTVAPLQFRPVLDDAGNAVFSQVISLSGLRVPFATTLMGQFVFTTVP